MLIYRVPQHGVFLVEKARKESVDMWSSRFGTRWMLEDRTVMGCTCDDCSDGGWGAGR
jgi:hypothetical protein